jgi:imidazoleglycerol-phosphate dehydratase
MTRTARLSRETKETKIEIELDLDGRGDAHVSTGVGFFDHLLISFGHHGMFDLSITCDGDTHIDDHHTVEDTALVLGEAFAQALGDRVGITRFGDATVPMDESRATAMVDISGRSYGVFQLPFVQPTLGNLSTQNIPHALEAFTRTAGVTLHISAVGANDHHMAEAAFKAFARAMRAAVSLDPRRSGVASTKGVL